MIILRREKQQEEFNEFVSDPSHEAMQALGAP